MDFMKDSIIIVMKGSELEMTVDRDDGGGLHIAERK